MKKENCIYYLLAIVFCQLFSNFLSAQISLNASGGDAIASDGSVSYSIGQMNYISFNQIDGKLLEGVQQTYESDKTRLDFGNYIKMEVYPNPTKDNVVLEIFDYVDEDYSYILFGMAREYLKSDKISSKKTKIILENYSTGAYVLAVLDEQNKLISSFKILKK